MIATVIEIIILKLCLSFPYRTVQVKAYHFLNNVCFMTEKNKSTLEEILLQCLVPFQLATLVDQNSALILCKPKAHL